MVRREIICSNYKWLDPEGCQGMNELPSLHMMIRQKNICFRLPSFVIMWFSILKLSHFSSVTCQKVRISRSIHTIMDSWACHSLVGHTYCWFICRLLALGLMEYNTDWEAIHKRFLPCKSTHQVLWALDFNLFFFFQRVFVKYIKREFYTNEYKVPKTIR